MNWKYVFGLADKNVEERLNCWSHFCGVIAGLVGFFILWKFNKNKSIYSEFSIVVYGVSIILLFLSSTLYHGVEHSVWKQRLRILDHINIYYLIAGTYTPVALISLIHGNGWLLFCTVWIIAAVGTLLKIFFTGRFEFVSLFLYVAMGWLIIFDFQNLLDSTTELGLTLLFLGGFLYTSGIIFYAFEKIPYNHFIWHLFVLAGATCHWFFIYTDVV